MAQALSPDICVIGAGPAGLAVAALAAQYGVSVVLVERGKMGGDSLNAGSVPSKALIAAARRAHDIRDSLKFGIRAGEPEIDRDLVARHVQGVIDSIAPNDAAARFNGFGVDIVRAGARFVSGDLVSAGDYRIKARRFVIATGSSPAVPPIPGLDRVPFLTNETIFSAPVGFGHLLVIGAASWGLELAQAYRRLGSQVTVVEAGRALPRDDPEMRDHLLKALRDEGVRILENARVERVEPFGTNLQLVFATQGKSYSIEGTHILLAGERTPRIAGLDLEAGGIKYNERGIIVTRGLKTSNKRVYAAGDVTGAMLYAHVATYHASVIVKNALFRSAGRATLSAMPWMTFTDPEIAHVGMTEEAARAKHGRLTILRWPYAENGRAQAERRTGGFLKVLASPEGKILGAGIVGANAGEIIQMWSLALQKGMTLEQMSEAVFLHPTFAELNGRAALSYFAAKARHPLRQRFIGLLAKLG